MKRDGELKLLQRPRSIGKSVFKYQFAMMQFHGALTRVIEKGAVSRAAARSPKIKKRHMDAALAELVSEAKRAIESVRLQTNL